MENPWQSVFSDGTSGWQNTLTGETTWGAQPDWSPYVNTHNSDAGTYNTLTDLGKSTFTGPTLDQLQMNGFNTQLMNQVANDPWQMAGFVNSGPQNSYAKSVEYGKQFNMDPAQAYQWWQQGQGNTNLYAGATDTGNWALRDAWGAENMLRQSGNWTPEFQNSLNQYVDQGYQDMNARRSQDNKDEMGANLQFAGMLAALVGGAAALNGGFGMGSTDFVGSDWAAGLAGTDNPGLLSGMPGYGGGFDFNMPFNIEDSVLNSGGTYEPYLSNDYSIPGMGSTPKPGALENFFANSGYSGQGTSSLLNQLFGGGGNNMTQPNGQGYRPDWGGILGALMEYQGQSDMQDKLEQYMQQAAGSADPFKQHRAESGNMLMDLYRDPMSNQAMQSLALNARRAMEAKDAAAGRNSQYGERETQLAGLIAGQLPQIANPLLTMSGANRAGADADVYSKFAMPMATTELAKSGALGYGVNAALTGQQPSVLQQVIGGQQQQGTNLFDFAKQLGGSVFDIFSSWA